MSQLISCDQFLSDTLPNEVVLHIIYQLGGIQHPCSDMLLKYIRDYHKPRRCWWCHCSDVGLSKCPKSYVERHINISFYQNLYDEASDKIYICYGCAH